MIAAFYWNINFRLQAVPPIGETASGNAYLILHYLALPQKKSHEETWDLYNILLFSQMHSFILHDSKRPVLNISCSSTEDQAQYEEYQENKEQNLRNTSRTGCNTTETKDGCDDSNNQKDNRPA